jgi:N-acetylneuraminic acid mutarotase
VRCDILVRMVRSRRQRGGLARQAAFFSGVPPLGLLLFGLMSACSSDDAGVDTLVEPSSPGAAEATGGAPNGDGTPSMPGAALPEGALGDDPASSTQGPPAPGEYGERAPLLAPNSEMAVAEVGGKIYVLGGYPSSRDVQTTVQVYDPGTDAWSFAAPMLLPTHHPVAVGFEGKVYSLGGQLEGDVNTERAFALDVGTDTWSELQPLPTPRGGGAAARIDDRIYVVGGRPPAGNAFEVYDVSDDAWTPLPSLPVAFNERNHLIAAAIGGKVYVAGGRYDGGGFGSPMTDSLDVFDPALGTWSSAAPMLRPRGGLNGVVALGCFHTWGGEGTNTGEPNDVFPDHDVYDPVTDTWSALPPLPIPVHGVTGGVFLDGLIHMPGGGTASGGNSGSVVHQVFRPSRRCDAEAPPAAPR